MWAAPPNTTLANSPRAMPGAFLDYAGEDRDAYDTAHLFPLGYRELVPYYEWVESTLPVQTAPMGTKEEVFYRGAEGLGLPVQTTKDITRAAFRPQENAILQPGGTAGQTKRSARTQLPAGAGLHLLRPLPPGVLRAPGRAAQSEGQAFDR